MDVNNKVNIDAGKVDCSDWLFQTETGFYLLLYSFTVLFLFLV